MNQLVPGSLLLLAAYICGSTPFGYLTGRFVGKIDIRRHGSGNVGSTNVGRVLGTRWGLLVLALDLLKGLLPVALLPPVFFSASTPERIHWQVAAGVATIMGHVFSFWLGFRGGKGVATALGVVAWLSPFATQAAVAIFVLAMLFTRYVSLSSILASLGFAVCQAVLLWPDGFSSQNWSLTAFSLLAPALIVVRHRENIGRLMRGTEPKYQSRGGNSKVEPPQK